MRHLAFLHHLKLAPNDKVLFSQVTSSGGGKGGFETGSGGGFQTVTRTTTSSGGGGTGGGSATIEITQVSKHDLGLNMHQNKKIKKSKFVHTI